MTKKEAQKKGLKPWKPGQSGNPKGRPKGAKNTPLTYFKRYLEKEGPLKVMKRLKKKGIDLVDGSYLEMMNLILLHKAVGNEDLDAIKEINKYTLPKPAQEISIVDNTEPNLIATREELEEQLRSIDELES